MVEMINTRKDLTAFKRKYTMARNAGADAFLFKGRTVLLSFAKLKIEIAEARLNENYTVSMYRKDK